LGVTADNCLILVATDSPEVCDVLHATGVMTIMTPSELPSGTDRIMSALNRLPASAHQRISDSTLVINLQGDEPFFHEEDIESLVSAMLRDPNIPMGTLAYPQADPVQFMKTSVVKIVSDTLGHALYFSRSPIPWPRESLGASHSVTSVQESVDRQTALSFLQHVGVYAFRMNALKQFTSMPPSDLELCEGLEQLRALSAGWKIKLVIAHEAPFGIDTPEDLKRAEEYFATKGQKL
jgi:3-deoxy-manno-octulosonate cytidylyltransferase (CMP-KDO synthetase)